MEILSTIPENLNDYLKSENQLALESLLKDANAVKIPMHTAPMKILDLNNTPKIKQIIVPPINVYMLKNYMLDDNFIDRNGLSYHVSYNNERFPIAHVYKSGLLCLGSIFVPSKISIYTPLQPLETLFLNNDRVVAHGDVSLKLNKQQLNKINDLLINIDDIDRYLNRLSENKNIVKNDSLWLLSNHILETSKTKEKAFALMNNVYKIIFERTE